MRVWPWIVAAATACATTTKFDRAIVDYDAANEEAISRLLLLNIARAHQNQPMHFTAISSVVATYKFNVSGGIAPAATGDRGLLPVPTFNIGAEESPTFTIAPMSGEEFTQRLLTPFQEQKLTLLLRQGYDVDTLFRLLGAELRLASGPEGKLQIRYNRPSDKDGYTAYRRAVAHMSSIQDRHSLHVEPLHFQLTWTVPADSVTPENFNSTYKDFSITFDPGEKAYRVTKRINGRVMISNYDPAILTNEERARLHEKAEEVPYNDILVDIRAGHVGGDFPMHGTLRLRSFHEVLTFIGRGIKEEPEFDVQPDPRTPKISENPARTIEIYEGTSVPPTTRIAVSLNGYKYALRNQPGYQWNKKAFSVLYQLFQMSVSKVEATGPAITIAK